MIYERNWRELAGDIVVDSFYANPPEVRDPHATARALSSALRLDYKKVLKKLRSGRNFVWIKRQVTPGQSVALNGRKLDGIGSIKEYKRFYPKRELASRLIGFSGVDSDGLAGIEHSFNHYLRGGGRWLIVENDAKGRRMRSIEKKSSRHKRCDIVLTIDETIQHIAEKELGKRIIQTRAKAGVAVVMNPGTGEILAMADYPPFNPNQFSKYSSGNWRNKVVSNAYEPGSTFKAFLASAAIESAIDPGSMFFCENGKLLVGGVAIHEASFKKYGWLSMVDIIRKSSNIGAIKIAQRLGKRRFHQFIAKFGFGAKTGIDLEGEATGIARGPKEWTPLSLCSMAIGQEISVTPIQMITAISAIANGGFLMKPKVVKGIYRNGKIVKLFEPEIVRRVISRETSRVMTSILRKVVEHGTGRKAGLEGYSIVGKTGTAQEFDKGINAYSKSKYLASFVGYFPAEDPQVAILVMVDEPRTTFWGGSVAAPVFREIARQTARYLNIPSKAGRVMWVKRLTPGDGRLPPEDYFNEDRESGKDHGASPGRLSVALKRLKNSPRFYNDLQIQRKL